MAFLEVDGKQLYYEEQGTGEALVLAHSALMHSGMYDAQMSVFAAHYRVIRYDQYGFGRSVFTEQKQVDDVRDLTALLDHLGVQRAVVLGTSMGAEMVLNFALQRPERVKGMILVGAGLEGYDYPEDQMGWWGDFIGAVRQPDSSKAIQVFLDKAIDSATTPLTADVRAYLAATMAEYSFGHYRDKTLQYAAMEGDAPAKRLGAIQCPTLVMVGAGDMPVIRDIADVLARDIQGAQKLVVPGAAHLVNLQQPEAFNRAVMTFMDGVHP